jgi:spore photoproduct lyase
MRVYQKEFRRLKQVKSLAKSGFSRFGVNKEQELTRLLYEISKREDIYPSKIIAKSAPVRYYHLKKYLLQRRYPNTFFQSKVFKPYLPKIELRAQDCFYPKKRKFSPKNILVEKKAKNSFLAKQFKDAFPKADFQEIGSLKDYRCHHRSFGVEDYNRRQDSVFIIHEGYDFFKKCPCTKNALSCGYHIFNLGFGCIFECTYCYLQDYTNSSGIIFPANIERFFARFNSYKKRGMRIGTGEFSDSLALDEITQYSIPIIEFFRKHKDVTFEFKTKSANIENLLKTKHAGNIVISCSLSPQSIIDENEFFTASLKERLDALAKCLDADYRAGLHFDPIIYFAEWQDEYELLIESLFNKINPKHIAWISLGTFRFRPSLKQIIERRFPGNKILNEELLLGHDGKLRYPYALRYNIYKKMLDFFSQHSRLLKVYLCMEDVLMWRDLKLNLPEF